jgi:hypothetical protein
MIMGKLTSDSTAVDSTVHPAHQSHVLHHDCNSLGVYCEHICHYSNILVKIVVIGDTGLTLKFID